MFHGLTGAERSESAGIRLRTAFDLSSLVIGILAVLLFSIDWTDPDSAAVYFDGNGERAAASGGDPTARSMQALAREYKFGGYGGVTYTQPSTVTINNPGRTDMTVSGFEWIGRPFKSPIYYGLRAIAWSQFMPFGAMLDFTHAKTIAGFDEPAKYTGTLNGQPLPASGRIGDVFKHLEFSHGHNMLTINGIARLGMPAPFLRPYVGMGGGVSVPHTEIGFRSENGRTYEYQFAGFVGQGLVGVEIPLGPASVFLEYKFSYAPYDVPLSGVVNGWLLVTDLWRQFRAWLAGEPPPGGHLTTTLATHHAIAGVLARVGRRASLAP